MKIWKYIVDTRNLNYVENKYVNIYFVIYCDFKIIGHRYRID